MRKRTTFDLFAINFGLPRFKLISPYHHKFQPTTATPQIFTKHTLALHVRTHSTLGYHSNIVTETQPGLPISMQLEHTKSPALAAEANGDTMLESLDHQTIHVESLMPSWRYPFRS